MVRAGPGPAAYLTAIGLSLVRLLLGGFDPNNVLEVTAAPGAALELGRVQLFGISALALAGLGVLAARRLGAGRPLRRSRAVLVDAFALALVMIAVLFLTAASRDPGSRRSGGPPCS